MIKILEQSENISHEYCCTVVKLGEIVPIEGSDFLGTAMVEGRTIVVRKDEVKEGNVMIYASNESQLNKDFLSINNQFEDKELNVDKEKKGYFNKYGRIRMIKLRGQVSMGYLFDKNALVTYCPKCASLEKNELEEYLNISKKERKELEKILDDKLSYIAKLEQTVRVDTFRCVDTMYVENGIPHIGFNYKDKWVELDGETTLVDSVPQTQVNTLAMDAPLTVGLTDEYRIFVKTANPYISFSNIEGAVIDKPSNGTKPKRWNIGIQVGIGGSYGLINKRLDFGPYIGAGISYGFGF